MKVLRLLLSDWEILVDVEKKQIIDSDHSADATRVAEYFGAKIEIVEPDLPEEATWELPYKSAEELIKLFC